jgi:hypothetical protein
MRRIGMRALFALLVVSLLGVTFATPSHAYGQANWQATFSGTGTAPGMGGFGFWGWCDFAGGVTSGNEADCSFAEYGHGTGGSGFTCHENVDGTAWDVSGVTGDFVIESGTISVNPVSLTGPCLAFFPGPAGIPVDTGIPAAAGHYNLGSLGPGLKGSFQMQVTQIP